MIVKTKSGWVLVSGQAAIALGVDKDSNVVQTYLGATLPEIEDYPQAHVLDEHVPWRLPIHFKRDIVPTGEKGNSNEQTLAMRIGDATRGLVLRYHADTVEETRLTLHLRDTFYAIDVTVTYDILPVSGLFDTRITVHNETDKTLYAERLFSLAIHMPGADQNYAMTHFDGLWGDELRPNREVLAAGTRIRESRRLVTSHEGTPFFALDYAAPELAASEARGDVWFGALHWSGNWKLIGEGTRDGRTIVHLGLNDYDFELPLAPGEAFETPRATFGYVGEGYGAMSRALQTYQRQHLAPRKSHMPPVVYNSWYATEFNVSQDQQIALAKKAAAMGVEMFVLDDGWFAGRVNDHAGLGDWWVDEKKFPNGLTGLCKAVHDLGMGFGVWVEPEMVNPDSDLYRAHPDWVLHEPGRDRTEIRNQLMLNMARPDVQDYLIDLLDKLLTENPIDFIKWDMNRGVTEPGWPDYEGEPRTVWVRHTQGVYRVWDTLRARHPKVIWENCAGGGGRLDFGLAARTEQAWASDNVSAPARLHIQQSYSMLFPAGTMASWVCDDRTGRQSLEFRFHMAMAGALGVGGDLSRWPEADLDEAARHITTYKSIRELVTFGQQYRLSDVTQSDISAPFFVAEDGAAAVAIVARLGEGRPHAPVTLFPKGLTSQRQYRLAGTKVIKTGQAWMTLGFETAIAPYESEIIKLEEDKDA